MATKTRNVKRRDTDEIAYAISMLVCNDHTRPPDVLTMRRLIEGLATYFEQCLHDPLLPPNKTEAAALRAVTLELRSPQLRMQLNIIDREQRHA